MNAITTTEEPSHPIAKLDHQLSLRASEFAKLLPAGITPQKLQRVVLTAAQSNPDILAADRQSLIVACMKAAQDGLVPDGREAALVPFKENKKDAQGKWHSQLRVQYMPMVYGLRKKILQSGEIRDIQTAVVYRQEIDQGRFIYEEGTERQLRHKPCLDPDFAPSDDDVAAAYSIATFKDGTMSFEVLPRRDINKIREKSQTGALLDKKGQPRTPSGPWVDWFDQMAQKSAMRRHSKKLPMSSDIVDVEAMEQELASQSATDALNQVEGSRPEPILPSAETFDPQTGEIIDGNRSAEDEEVARHADAAAMRQMDREGEPEPVQEEERIEDARQAQVSDWLNTLQNSPQYAAAIEKEFLNVSAALTDEQRGAVEAALADAKRSA